MKPFWVVMDESLTSKRRYESLKEAQEDALAAAERTKVNHFVLKPVDAYGWYSEPAGRLEIE